MIFGMIVSLSVNLIPEKDVSISGFGGEAFHGFIFHLMRMGNKELSREMHSKGDIKPLAIFLNHRKIDYKNGVSFFPRKKKIKLAISFLTDKGVESILKGFTRIMLKEIDLRLKGKNVNVNPPQIISLTSFKEIDEKSKNTRKIQFSFLSPTSFRSKDTQIILPLPELVFGSLFKKWNTFSPVKFPEELKEKFTEIRISKYNLKTEMIHFSTYKVKGFKGNVMYELPSGMIQKYKKQLNALADFAFYAGVGYKTTMGLGQTRRIYI